MQPETLYKGHTIVPFCSEGPRYKAHYKLTPPGGVGSQWTYLTAEYTTEVAALEAALAAAKKVVDRPAAAGQVVATASRRALRLLPVQQPPAT